VGNIRLIVNADDFGASEEVNEGVIRGFREGVLTSCSLIVTGDAFVQAVQLARENPHLAVGIHLVVVSGRSVLTPLEIPSLVDNKGCFSNQPVLAGMKYYFLPQARQELKKELAAQFEKFHTSGLRCSHIDGHWHFHTHPVIFDLAIRMGKQYGVRQMRVPEDDLALALRFDPSSSAQKRLYGIVFKFLCNYMRRHLSQEGFSCTDRVYGFFETGRMNSTYFLWLLDQLCSETNEIYLHPAYHRNDPTQTAAKNQCLAEYRALVDERVIRRIRQLGIHLTTYEALSSPS